MIIAAVGAFLVVRMHADLVAAMDARLDQGGDQVALGYHAEGRPEALDVSATVLSGEGAASQVLTPTRRVVVSYGDRAAMAPMLAPGELSRVLAGRRVRRTVTLGAGREHSGSSRAPRRAASTRGSWSSANHWRPSTARSTGC